MTYLRSSSRRTARSHGRRWPVWLLVAIGAVAPSIALAPSIAAADEDEANQADSVVNELLVGEAVATQHRYELQGTAGLTWERRGREVSFTPFIESQFGIIEGLEIGVEVPFTLARLENGGPIAKGLGNAEVGVNYALFSSRAAAAAVTIGVGVELPATSSDVGEQALAIGPLLVLYKKLGALHLNASISPEVSVASFEDEGDEDEGDVPSVSVTGALSAYAELGPLIPTVEIGGAYDDGPTLTLAPGILWHPATDVELGLALIYKQTPDAPAFGAQMMASFEVDLGDDDDDGGDDSGSPQRSARR